MAVAQKILGDGADPHEILSFDRNRGDKSKGEKGKWVLRADVDRNPFSQWLPGPE
jgi:hypothetical protein